MRGFEIISSYHNMGINIPQRQTKFSAGYDIEAAESVELNPLEKKLIKTGLKAYMQEDEVLNIYIRSSMAVKKNAMLANNVGIIDADYYNNESNEGHILIPMINFGNDVLKINKGDKIAQGIFQKFLLIDKDLSNNIDRMGGFGTTNIKI
ncbi:MAG: dut [Haloplasmataceae bacterium]|jgi:dUTP pyrophosphatase|nr:dut [Haloplasmataceae bacterium]